jgi:hypothetical protein
MASDCEVAPAEQRRLALCLAIAKQLGMVDYLRAEVFQRRYLISALKAGSRVDITRGLALESTFSSHMPYLIGGGLPRAEALHARACELSRPSDPVDARGLVQFARGMIEFAKGNWQLSRAALEEAVTTFREKTAVGRRWDIVYCRSFVLLMHWMQGNVAEIRRDLPDCLAEATGNLTFEAIISLRVWAFVTIWDDKPDDGHRLVAEVMAPWPDEPWRLPHEFEAIALAELDLYAGLPDQAWRRLQLSWRRSRSAGFYQVHFFYLLALILRVRVGLAAGRRVEAMRDVRLLEKRAERWAMALGDAFRASLLAKEDPNRAEALLLRAIAELDHWELGLYAIAARYRWAELKNDASCMRDALENLRARGVHAPRRLIDSLLPADTTLRLRLS